MSDNLARFIGLGVVIALVCFGPRRRRRSGMRPPVSAVSKAWGVVLLTLLALVTVLQPACDALLRPSR